MLVSVALLPHHAVAVVCCWLSFIIYLVCRGCVDPGSNTGRVVSVTLVGHTVTLQCGRDENLTSFHYFRMKSSLFGNVMRLKQVDNRVVLE